MAEADAATVRADRHTEFGGQQEHGQHFVQPAQTGRIKLTEVHRLSLEKLLEHHTVMRMFAGGHANRVNPLADCGVSENVVGAGGFFDPPRVEFGQATHVGDRLIDIPDLIGVHHQLAFPAKLFAQDLCSADILLDIRADFLLEMVPAFGNGLTRQ